MTLSLRPMTLKAANRWVDEVHRHHKPVTGHKFSVGVEKDGELVGVAIAGRPVGRGMDNGKRLEINRVATDGTKNACSFLYATMAKAGQALGYERHDIFTYILSSEPGTSLRAAGWVPVAVTQGGSWDTPTRRREDHAPTEPKVRWHAALPPGAVEVEF